MKPFHLYIATGLICFALFASRHKTINIGAAPRPIYIVAKPIRFYTSNSNINFNVNGCLHGYDLGTNEAIIHLNDGEDHP